jgi:hypothetical protein
MPDDGSETPPLRAALTCEPVFVVGCSRSGTTLLRLMLNSHPSLAIPDESHFIIDVHRSAAARRDPATALGKALSHRRFARWGLDPALVWRLAEQAPPRCYAEAMTVIFAAYAQREGKPRWGDKSPPYAAHLPLLAELFPLARFVHVIRDGREVAASLAAHRWAPTTPIACASYWRAQAGAAREAGWKLGPGRYLEVRLERLIAEPDATLRRVCEFIGEPFDRKMLDYRGRAQESVWSGDVDHRHLHDPPTPALRDWRAGLGAGTQRAVQAAAQPLLAELGYAELEPATLLTRLRIAVDRPRRLPLIVVRELRQLVRPAG